MEVFIRGEDMKYAVVDKSQFEPYSFLLESYDKIKVKSLEQHDAEVRAEEKKKVVAELEKWIKYNRYFEYDTETQKVKIGGINVDSYELQKKLNELKGE